MAKEYFLLYDSATGALIFRGDGPEGTAARQAIQPGWVIITLPVAHADTALADIPMPVLADALWAQVKVKRDAAIDGGAVTPVGAVDSDALSRTNLIGAYCAAKELGAAYAMDWTMLDNSVITIDAPTMIGMALAVMSHVNACHGRARALRDAIEAAADLAALLAIDIHAGWPS